MVTLLAITGIHILHFNSVILHIGVPSLFLEPHTDTLHARNVG